MTRDGYIAGCAAGGAAVAIADAGLCLGQGDTARAILSAALGALLAIAAFRLWVRA